MHLNWTEHKALVQNIIRQMTVSQYKPDYVVGINGKGSPAAMMIAEYFNIPGYSLLAFTEHNCWMADDAFAGKKILVVTDANKDQDVFEWIVNSWTSANRPDDNETWELVWNNTVKNAVLVEDVSSVGSIVDFNGMEIDSEEAHIDVKMPWVNWWEN